MKAKRKITLGLITSSVVVALFLSSCGGSSGGKGVSAATGWEIKQPAPSGQQGNSPGLVFIEGGTFTMGKVQDDVMRDWNNVSTKIHVQSFYIDETEVTNFMYLEYLGWMKYVFPPTQVKYKNIYDGACPDTLVWRNRLGYAEVMINNYLRHPAYANYPVVGVNWIQSVEYAKWRTNRVNEDILEKKGYLKKNAKTMEVSAEKSFDLDTYIIAPTKTFGGNDEIVLRNDGRILSVEAKKGKKKEGDAEETPAVASDSDQAAPEATAEESPADSKKSKKSKKPAARNVYAQRSSGILLPEYRLPTEAEWEYAAMADKGQREYNLYKGRKKYPWAGKSMQSTSEKAGWGLLANYKQAKGDYGGIAGWSGDNADVTNQIKSYPPNDFGLYDMAGNVAEWVADVYRPVVDADYTDFNYFRGNVFSKNKIGKDGKVILTTRSTMKFDTLSNGKVIARSFPGQLEQVPAGEDETFLRSNFDKSFEVDFRDGDAQSSRNYKNAAEIEARTGTSSSELARSKMYNSPQHNIKMDSAGNLVRKFDKSNKRTTLINNKTRVYKGGSWRDRAYWLNPAQRRYFPEDMAADYIGFRCAMSAVGPKTLEKRSPRN